MKKTILTFCSIFSSFFVQTTFAQTTHFTENFGTAALPAGWSNDSMGLPALNLWIFNNQYNRTITGVGFDANFAIFDSDEGSTNDNIDENASLTSPSINIAAATGVLSLEFVEQYRALAGPNTQGSSRRVEITSDGGITWNTLVFDSMNVGYPNPATHTAINISSSLGATNIQVRFTYTGSYDWWWAIDNVTIKSFPGCTTAPNAGSTTASAASVCSGVKFTLSLAGADSGIVISYQWQSSPDSINWTSISSAIAPTLTTSTTVATYYRCVLTCSGFSANSDFRCILLSYPLHFVIVQGLTYDKAFTINLTNVNETPTDLALSSSVVAEHTTNGTTVGSVTPTDPDSGDTFTYQLTDTAGGRFAINVATGEITVADGSLLHSEVASSHDVTVRVTDSGGVTYDKTFTINLIDVNEAPEDLVLSSNTVGENAANGTVIGTVTGTDFDTGDTVRYSFTDSAGGRFAFNPVRCPTGS